MEETKRIREVLSQISNYSIKCWLYLSEIESWSLDSPCLVLESEEVLPGEEDDLDGGRPECAKRLKMMRTLTVSEVCDLVANAKMQKADVDDNTLFEAFIHYYDNDAYLEIK